MHVHTDFSLLAAAPVLLGTATYTRTPAPSLSPYPNDLHSVPESDSTPTSHRVDTGDNLTRIVRQFFLDQGRSPDNMEIYDGVKAVVAANGLSNPDLIYPGQVLDLSALLRASGRHSTPPLTPASLPQSLPFSITPAPVTMAPAPAQSLLDATELRDLAAPDSAAAAPLRDRLLENGTLPRPDEPIKIAANTVSALMQPPAPVLPQVGRAPKRHHVPAGGPGPVPSDAAIALQRVLNSTSNALSMLRNLVDQQPDEDATAALAGPWQPVLNGKARLTSEFGMRKDPFTGRMEFHDGIDLGVKRGTEITALRDGEVVYSGWKGGYGNTVIVRHDDGLESLYGHTARNHVEAGQTVRAGTVIADVGSTGRSTGPHLHLEVRRHGMAVNPMPYLEESRPALGQ